MQIKPITALSEAEAIDLATHAAERGERIEDVNPFPEGTVLHAIFARAFAARAADLAVA